MSPLIKVKNIYIRARRFGFSLQLCILIIAKLKYWIPSFILQKMIRWRDESISNKLQKIWDNIDFDVEQAYDHDSLSNCIWVCWLQGEEDMPAIPQLCLNSLKKYACGHPIILLTLANYTEYVSIPASVVDLFYKKKISAAHFSDVIRVNLLYQKGGFWVDATMLFTADIDNSIFQVDFFSIKNHFNESYISKGMWTGFCMASKSGGILMKYLSLMYERYWAKNDCIIDYLLMDYMISWLYACKKEIRLLVDIVPFSNENVHVLSHMMCSHFSLEEWRKITVGTSMFKLSWKRDSLDRLQSDKDNYYNFLLNYINSPI